MNNQILSTTNYELFGLSTTNRPIKTNTVTYKSLRESIKQVGQLQPIIVDKVKERLVIIDGQHRYTACKELAVPLSYIVVVGGLKNLVKYQDGGTRKNWSQKNYIEHYLSNRNYERLNDLLTTNYIGFYPTVSSIELMVSGKRTNSINFNDGRLTLSQANYDNFKANVAPKLKKIVSVLGKDRQLINKFFRDAVVRTLVKVITSRKYNEEIFLKNLKKGKDDFPATVNPKYFAMQLVKLYNKRISCHL